MIICAPVISQMAVEGAVRHDWAYPSGFRQAFHARRRIMQDGLAAIPRLAWAPTPAGLFAFVQVDGCADSRALALEILERERVVTIPGAAFGRCGEGYLRLSYGYASELELEEALGRLHRFFDAH